MPIKPNLNSTSIADRCELKWREKKTQFLLFHWHSTIIGYFPMRLFNFSPFKITGSLNFLLNLSRIFTGLIADLGSEEHYVKSRWINPSIANDSRLSAIRHLALIQFGSVVHLGKEHLFQFFLFISMGLVLCVICSSITHPFLFNDVSDAIYFFCW